MGNELRDRTEVNIDIDEGLFRRVVGSFASGLTIVTATTEEGPAGFTCQSFSSLSLNPALVLFCPNRSSTTWPRIREVGKFCVNVLSCHHEDLSRKFAKSGSDKFSDVSFTASPNGSPCFTKTLAWLDCQIHAEYDGGDHTIVVGAVSDLAISSAALAPLLFHGGQYLRVHV